ncbi:MAG: zinc-ribbon domain-containing protein [Firmicutes bacterium]|nr:zinc-ribbon domain-containing protein [Bacillota bacterium]MDY5857178.1 zinc-ribbon domain-containing protein [Anaerovoracaceae bacterium]
MFCTNCGKKLHDGDRFCANCGTRVREEAPEMRQEVVFNPPFKAEAEHRTRENFTGFAEGGEEAPKPRKTEPAHFDWNLDGFPAAGVKKTEEVNFNWDSVIERKKEKKKDDTRSIPTVPVVDKIDISSGNGQDVRADAEYKPEVPAEPAADGALSEAFSEQEPEAEPVPEGEQPRMNAAAGEAAELEEEIFGKNYHGIGSTEKAIQSGNTAQLEKFYTFNEKKEAFQELLDKEYERLRSMEEERKPDAESLEFTWAGKLFPEQSPQAEAAGISETAAETGSQNGDVPADTIDFSPIRKEARLRSQIDRPETVKEMQEKTEEPEGKSHESGPSPSCESEEKPEPFPGKNIPDDDTDSSDSGGTAAHPDEETKKTEQNVRPEAAEQVEESWKIPAADLSEIFDDEEEEPRGMSFLVKLVVTLLVLLILLEGTILAVRFVAPDSAFSVKAGEITERILDKITGGSDDPAKDAEQADADSSEQETYLSGILRDRIEPPETIGSVQEDVSLKYDDSKSYAFGEELAQAGRFVDETWTTDENGRTVTKAEAMMEALVSYYDQWQATNKDTSLIGINKLEIGEIRSGENGYYVLCRLTFAAEDGSEAVKYVTVNVKESQDSMVINEIKEETL